MRQAPFKRMLNGVLGDIPGVSVYLDDILVVGDDLGQHRNRLDRVLKSLTQ